MNKMIKILFGLLISVFLVGNINAQSTYSQAEKSASEYVNSNLNIKTNYQRYLKVVDDNSKFYNKGNPGRLYSLGGLLSYEEFAITTKKKSNSYSYLFESDEYWTSTNDSGEKKIVAKTYKKLEPNELSNVRVTEYVLSNVRVNGMGTFSDPWIFQPQYIITLKTNDKDKGKLKETQTGEPQNQVKIVMTNDSLNANVYVAPESGYQYLGNTCGIIINDLNIRNKESGKSDMLVVQDVTRDIECTINFGEKSDRIILYSYNPQPDVPSELYVIKNKSWYEDSTNVKAITKLSKNPTMEGYEYKGYWTQTNKESGEFTSECKGIKIIGEDNTLASPSLKTDGTTTGEAASIYSDGKTIYPCFKAKNYNIKYSCDGTTIKEERTYVFNVRSKLLSGDICSKTGYEFQGWLDEEGNSYDADSTEYYKLTTKESMTLKAIWKAKKYTVSYYIGNASSTVGNKIIGTQTCEYDADCTLKSFSDIGVFPYSYQDETKNGAKNYGWSFYGWSNEASDLTTEYNNQAKFKYTIDGPLNLYAIGTRQMYFNGGIAPTAAYESPTQYWNPYGITDTYLTNVAIPTAKTISSWNFIGYRCGSSEASSTITLAADLAGTNYKVPYNNYPYTRSVYSRTLTLKYDANEGTGTTSDQTTTQYYNSGYGKNSANNGASITSPTFTLATPGFTKTGYSFAYWTETKNASTGYNKETTYTFAPGVSLTTIQKTLYAKWNIVNYTITYYLDGGTLSSSAPTSYNYTTDTITLMTPTKTNNGFLGWYTESTFTNAVTTIPKGSTGNKTFYAKWKPPTSLPKFKYTGQYKLVEDNDTLIAEGTNNTVTIPDAYSDYDGHWKIKFLTDGDLTIYDLGSASTIDIFLVGGGGKGASGAKYVAQSSRGGSGGGGGSLTTVSKFPAIIGTSYTIDIGSAASNTYWKLGSTVYFGANKGSDGCKPSHVGGGAWDSCKGAGGAAYSHTDNRGAANITATAGSNGGAGGQRQTGKAGTYEFHGTSGTRYGAGGGSGGGGDSTGTGSGRNSGYSGGSDGGGKGGGGCDFCHNGSKWTCCGTGSGSSGAANSGAGGGGGGGYCGSNSSSSCSNGSGANGGTGIVIIRDSR